jgi:fumarate reductase flavoprotein subunit
MPQADRFRKAPVVDESPVNQTCPPDVRRHSSGEYVCPVDELQADVVVVGSGAAGLSAAIEAHDAGAEVLVIESEPEVGGSTRLSGGYTAMCETELQPGSREELYADLVESHHFDADDVFTRLYVDNAASLYDRLREFGLTFAGLETFAHMSKPWAHVLPTGELGGGAQIAAALERQVRQRGIAIHTATKAERVARDDQGRVESLEVSSADGPRVVRARRAVVLASGGFTRNPGLVRAFGRPGSSNIVPITGPGSRGDGLVMAMALGAALSYIGVGVAPTAPVDPITHNASMIVYAGGIMLNKQGRRFVDESRVYLDLSWAGLAQTDGFMLQIYDDRIRRAYLGSMMGQVMWGATEYVADTVEGVLDIIAAQTDFDAAVGRQTITDYNRYVTEHFDPDFGRQHPLGNGGIGSDDGELLPIAEPPFYASPTVAGTTHFNGGLKVDDRFRVVDVFGQPIDGLFACGEVIGGFHGAGYMSATFVGSALIFGRMAGEHAAAVSLAG